MRHPALPVGLLLDAPAVPAWLYRSLELAIGRGDIEITTLILPRDAAPAAEPSGCPLWRLFLRLDRGLTRRRTRDGADPMAPCDIRSLAAAAQVLEVAPGTPEESILPADLERIRARGLAVLVEAGFPDLRGAVLAEGARFGVWSHHHGDPRRFRGGPAALWEYIQHQPTLGAVLQALGPASGGGRILAQCNCPTFEAVTWNSLRNRITWVASEMLPKALHRLALEGEAGFRDMLARHAGPFDVYDRRRTALPGAVDTLRAAARLFQEILEVALTRFVKLPLRHKRWIKYMEWAVMYRFGGKPEAPCADLDLNRFNTLYAPAGHFWADPFVIHHQDRYYLFVEDFLYDRGKGVIAVAELGEGGLKAAPEVVLEEPYHLSYPLVFEYQGAWYMIPETRKSKQIRLYRSERFPFDWRFHSVLVDGISAVDSTLVEDNGSWWLFACCANTGLEVDDGLHLFHAPSPLGPWTPHPHNPVNQDTYSMRPAGKCFRRGGRLFRPAQISVEYGWGTSVVEITELTPESYAERIVETLEPHWRTDIKGIHTLNMDGACMVVDCKLHRG
jgi:hypothetical protein